MPDRSSTTNPAWASPDLESEFAFGSPSVWVLAARTSAPSMRAPAPIAIQHVSLADLLREWNELNTARRRLAEAMRLAPRWLGRLDFQVLCLLVQARITAAQGDLAGALELVQEAKRHVRAPQAAWELDVLEACEAQLWVAQGNLPAAARWMQRQVPEGAL